MNSFNRVRSAHLRSTKRRVLLRRGSSSLQISASLVVPTLGDHRSDYILRNVFQSFTMSINRRRIKVRCRMVSVNFEEIEEEIYFPRSAAGLRPFSVLQLLERLSKCLALGKTVASIVVVTSNACFSNARKRSRGRLLHNDELYLPGRLLISCRGIY